MERVKLRMSKGSPKRGLLHRKGVQYCEGCGAPGEVHGLGGTSRAWRVMAGLPFPLMDVGMAEVVVHGPRHVGQSLLHGEGSPLRTCNDPCTSRRLKGRSTLGVRMPRPALGALRSVPCDPSSMNTASDVACTELHARLAEAPLCPHYTTSPAGEAEHAAIGHNAVLNMVPSEHVPILRRAMADHDRDFAAFYNAVADMIEAKSA